MDSLVLYVLDTDAKNRVVGQDDVDLFSMEDLKYNDWDYSFPTLVNSYQNSVNNLGKLQDFIHSYQKYVPFDVCMDNLLVAGGSVSSILRSGNYVKDVDIFVYGLDPEKATERIAFLLEDLTKSYKKYLVDNHNKDIISGRTTHNINLGPWVPNIYFTCVRNKNAITVCYDSCYTVQIILRLYKSKSEILHGFDLGSSAIGFDGKLLYFTSLGKFAHEYSCNIIDPSRRSTTYEKRLIKYFERGFEIILPNLNMGMLRTTNLKHNMSEVAELPHLVFSYSKIKGEKITIDRFLSANSRDCDEESDYQVGNLDEHSVFYINLRNLSQGTEDFYFIERDTKDSVAILNSQPTMSRRRVINYYDSMKERIEKGKSLSIKQLQKYIKDLKELGQLLLDGNVEVENAIITMVEEEKQRILKLVGKITDSLKKYPLQWKVDNPGSQLTGSFNPIFENPKDWYGSYML